MTTGYTTKCSGEEMTSETTHSFQVHEVDRRLSISETSLQTRIRSPQKSEHSPFVIMFSAEILTVKSLKTNSIAGTPLNHPLLLLSYTKTNSRSHFWGAHTTQRAVNRI